MTMISRCDLIFDQDPSTRVSLLREDVCKEASDLLLDRFQLERNSNPLGQKLEIGFFGKPRSEVIGLVGQAVRSFTLSRRARDVTAVMVAPPLSGYNL